MGQIKRGILGGFNGTIGTVVGGKWRGIDYMRATPIFSNTDPTPKQLAQRLRFALAVNFLTTMTDVLAVGFQASAIEMSGYNSAVSYTLDNAIGGADPNFTINYPDVLVSQGKLKNGKAPVITATVADTISFAWTDNSGKKKANATDKTILVVYCPDLNEAEYTIGGALRTAGADTIDVSEFKGKPVHAWMAFVTADGAITSDSFYAGPLTVL